MMSTLQDNEGIYKMSQDQELEKVKQESNRPLITSISMWEKCITYMLGALERGH
jgi:hypothetical protein